MGRNNLVGKWGEAAAAAYLRKHGYTIIACNYRSRFGEIDLIAQNKKFLVFCEVKTRKDAAFAQAAEFVDGRKQDRLRQTAAIWLSTHETQLQPRFDVIELYAPDGIATKQPTVQHLEDAFV